MRYLAIQVTVSFLILSIQSAPTSAFIRACYFANWATYRSTAAKYDVGDIDPNLCTHLIYAFANLDTNTKQLVASEPDKEDGANGKFRQFNYLKQKNPALRTLISIGGQNAHSDGFVAISQPDDVLNSFATSTVQFLRDRDFDGIDIDWEYPDKNNKAVFTKILKALRTAFDADTKSPKLLLTFAGPAGQWNIDPGFDVPEIAKYVDYANLMSYDYTDSTASLTAFNSPLYSRNDPRFNPTLSTNWTIHYWNSLGMPFNKILAGVTGLGRRLVLQNATNSAPGSNTTGVVRSGPIYQLPAGLAYPEICELLKNPSSIKIFDQEQMNPYLVNGDDWVGYEDTQSLRIKLQWMKDLGVAGLMFWSLDQDDFTGQFCGAGKYPLLNLVVSETTTAAPTGQTTVTPPQTTQDPNRQFVTMCYFPSWTKYRGNVAKYEVANIDPNICTHLIYAFGRLDTTARQLAAAEPETEDGPGNIFSKFNDLKIRNPALKTLISIGGQNDHSPGFQAVAETDDILQNFATTTVSFLRTRGFDGLDVDWEYPDASTKFTFIRLLQALRKAFDDDAHEPKLLLTFAGAAGQWNIDPGYDVPEIARFVDFANLMTYDYTDKWAKVAAFNSPLYSRNDSRFNPTLSTNWTVHYWNSQGMPYHKIVVGITGVGRRLVLQNTTNTGPGSNVTGVVRKGKYYEIEAGLAYPEICEMLSNTSTTRTFDQEQLNPYLVNGDDWVGYEDTESIGLKLDWMRNLGVAGLMFWSLDQDDFSGQLCGDGTYPLLSFVKQQLSNTSTETTTSATTASTQESTPSTSPTTVTAEITEMNNYEVITRSDTSGLQSLPVVIYILLSASLFLQHLFV